MKNKKAPTSNMIKKAYSYDMALYKSFPCYLRDRNDVYYYYADANDETNRILVAFYELKTANCCEDFDW